MRKQRRTVRGPQKALPGIPTKPNPQISFRVKRAQLDALTTHALGECLSLADWARMTLLKAAGVAP